jgi:hypothetical protein
LEGPKNYEKSKNPNDKYGQRRSDFNWTTLCKIYKDAMLEFHEWIQKIII